MPAYYKLIFFFIIWAAVFIGSYYAFRKLNIKIKTSRTGWELAKYSIILFLICATLFAGGLFLLIYGYIFIADPK